MGTLTAGYILERVQDTLQDTIHNDDGARWPTPELLRYLNDGQRAIAVERPDATAKIEVYAPTPNKSIQNIPATGARFLEINCHLTAGLEGFSVRPAPKDIMDTQAPNWRAATPSTRVTHYVFDIRNPRVFYLYPRPAPEVLLELVYSAHPADCTVPESIIALDDLYQPALTAYVIMRAYQKDEDYARNLDAARFWAEQYVTLMGTKTSSDATFNPNNNLGPDKVR